MTHEPKQAAQGRGQADQEGMALVLALIVLLVLTVIGAALMANVNTETKISGLKLRSAQAQQLAEAGVQEAMLRLRNGDVPDDLNPRNVTVIFNQVAGSLPTVGTDTTALPTLQPAGAYLPYTTATKSWSMLTMKYKTKGGSILRYDDAANPKINTATGNPIWIIKATGRQNGSADTVYAEVCRSKITVLAKGAVVANVGIKFNGNIGVCGHDHSLSVPPGTSPTACDAYLSPNAHGSCMPGAWSSGAVSSGGSSSVAGEPSKWKAGQTGFYSGPWDVFNMTQSDFYSWIGPPVSSEPASPHGIYYLDNNSTRQDASGSFSYTGGTGEGLLYVDGDLALHGNFTYTGMIYVEGNLTINGNVWILGGLVVNGKTTTEVKLANGSAVVLYSADAITQKITKYGGNMRTIAWREL